MKKALLLGFASLTPGLTQAQDQGSDVLLVQDDLGKFGDRDGGERAGWVLPVFFRKN